jgi:hypothetical protein
MTSPFSSDRRFEIERSEMVDTCPPSCARQLFTG